MDFPVAALDLEAWFDRLVAALAGEPAARRTRG